MSDLMMASTEADARAGEAVVAHHAELAAALELQVDQLGRAAAHGNASEAGQVRGSLVAWCLAELVPHALAEEQTLYPAAAALPEATLLVTAMLGEHKIILRLVDDIAGARDAVSAAAAARSLATLLETHLVKENDLLLPVLVAAPDVSVADLLTQMHQAFEAEAEAARADVGSAPQNGHGHGSCGCGETDDGSMPELDVRAIPHAIRHATVFGALHAVAPGQGMVLLVHHDPKPLLAQLEQREPGAFTTEYLERGPEVWRIAIVRRTS
jgi:uncharacterized protein (DUF2249 family)/iron-sulfur cluster repair protein YtfE (RIC family)